VIIRFKKKTTLPVCAYDDALRRWGSGESEKFDAGDETEVSLLRENEDTFDIEIPGSGIVFDLPKADVDVLPLDAVEGSHILQGILPWPWEAEPTTDIKTGEVRWEVLQGQDLHNGTHLGPGEWDILLCSDAKLTEAEARLIAKAPEMYVLLRQVLAGQPVMPQVGQLINELELSMERTDR
jgi:hypothetical protein